MSREKGNMPAFPCVQAPVYAGLRKRELFALVLLHGAMQQKRELSAPFGVGDAVALADKLIEELQA